MIAPPQTAATSFQSASLYVGDLHPEVTESLLFELFNRVGPVASIRVCRDSVTRRSLGYAYVNFHSVEDAERALDTMNFTEIKNKPCRIMWSQRDPSLRKSGLGNVYVRNLAPSVDNKGLYDTFSVSGNILSCKVATDDAGVSKGYGYVHFETAEAAQDAIQKFNGILIDEVEVSVSAFVKRSDRAGQAEWTNLYVKQFPLSWGDEELLQVFSPFGAVVSCAVSKDADGKSKGFGFVNFAEHDSAVKALAELHGKKIDVKQTAEEIAAEQLKIAEKERERLASEVLTTNVANAAASAEKTETEAGKEGADKENAEGAENKEEKKEGEKEEVEKKEGEDKSAAVAATAAATAALGVRVYELYVSRAQKKVERTREMKHKIDAITQEKITKYTGMNLYVKNVADSISDDEFREAFAPFGTITSARIMRDGTDPTKGSKGFGFVCYSSPEEATRAVTEMNGKSLSGKPIVVTLHQRKDARRLHLAATYAPQNMGGVGMRGPGFGPQGGMPGQPGMPMPPFMNMYMPPGAQPGFPGPGGVGGPRGGMPYGFPGNPMNAGGRGFFPGMPPFMQGMPGQQPGMGPNGFKGQRGPGGQNMPPGAFPVGMAGGPMPGQARGGGGMRMPGGGPQQGGPGVGGPGPGMGAGRPMSGMPGSMPPGASAGGGRGGGMFPPGQMPPPGSVQQAQAQAQAQQMRGGVKFNSQARNQQPGMMGGGGPGGGAGPMGVGAGGPGGMPTPQQQQQAMQQAVMAQQMHMQQQQQMAQQQQQQHQQAQGPGPAQGGKLDFSDAVLASADPLTQKNMIGERLYPLIFDHQPEQAGKITGMLLEMDNGELLNLIESPDALMSKIEEALTVLRNHKPADE